MKHCMDCGEPLDKGGTLCDGCRHLLALKRAEQFGWCVRDIISMCDCPICNTRR